MFKYSHKGEYSVDGEANELPSKFNLISFQKLFNFPQAQLTQEQDIPVDPKSDLAPKPVINDQNSNIQIDHSDWLKQLDLLVKRVVNELGCVTSNCVQAKLDRLVLYRNGMDKEETFDKKRQENQFATLCIQLPSKFTGGLVTCFHPRTKYENKSDLSEMSDIQVKYFAYTTDCTFRMKKIESGTRFVLEYLLCYTGISPPCQLNPKTMEIISDLSDNRDSKYYDHIPSEKNSNVIPIPKNDEVQAEKLTSEILFLIFMLIILFLTSCFAILELIHTIN